MGILKQQTVNGVKWLVGASVIHKSISFITTIIIARRLGPSVYGLFAFAMIIVASFELFKSLGIDAALIRKNNDFDKAANTAFFIIPFLGIVLYFLLNLSASTIGEFLNNQELVPIIRILGMIFVISSFSKVPVTLLERNLQFKKLSIAEFCSALTFSSCAIIVTFMNFGIWSLVFAYVMKVLIYMIIVWGYANWKPRLIFDAKLALEMFNFGKFVFIGSALWFVKMNLDNLLVGKLLGATMLGFYAVAFNIANFSADYFGTQIARVTYPAYTKIKDNVENMRSAFLRVFMYISLFAIPFGIGVILLSSELLRFVYGQKWIGATNALNILAWAGIFNTLPISTSGVLLACGKPKASLKIAATQVVLFFIFITPMANFMGLEGVAYVVSISSLIACIYAFYIVKRLLDINFILILSNLKPATISSLIMTAVVLLAKTLMLAGNQDRLGNYRFIILGTVAAIVYIYSLYKLEIIVFKEIKNMIFSKIL